MEDRVLDLGTPNPRQREFLLARERFVAYGGARGGGKSWAVRVKALAGALSWPGIRILIARRTYPELENTLIRPMLSMFARLGEGVRYNRGTRTAQFGNGAVIRFGHVSAGHIEEYQGQEYDWIFLDEATQFTQYEFRVLAATLRGTEDLPRRMYLTCNPGGVGHQWVKRLFIDRRFQGKERPEEYRFIPATVEDNTALSQGDGRYAELLDLLPEDLRRAHRYGDWDADTGQFFPEFDVKRHVRAGLVPRPDWRLFRAIDYGLDMFACLWVGVDREGRAWVYREVQEPRLVASEAARLMADMTPPGEDILATAAPPDLWSTQKDTGRTIEELFALGGAPLMRVSASRVAGWVAVKERLRFGPDGEPGLVIDESCRGLIANLQALRHSRENPSDADTRPHDITHICDALRYFCQVRVGGESGGDDEEDEEPALRYIYYGI